MTPWRSSLVAGVIGLLVGFLPGAAGTVWGAESADEPDESEPVVTQAAYIAEHWRHAPLFVSDNVAGAAPPRTVSVLTAQLKRMPVPTFLAVIPQIDGPLVADKLLDTIHHQLGRDGVYVLTSPTGIGLDAKQFGGVLSGQRLPIRDAAAEVSYSQPYDAGLVRAVSRFVDNVVSGAATRRYEAVKRKHDTGWEPETIHPTSEQTETRAFVAGIVAGCVITLGLVLWRARRKRATA